MSEEQMPESEPPPPQRKRSFPTGWLVSLIVLALTFWFIVEMCRRV